jgi:transposase InsO family protein
VSRASQAGDVSVRAACRWYGISPQAYYQARKRALQRAAEDQLVVELVQGMRQRHPRMGGRKLLHELRSPMLSLGISRGRDAFFNLLRTHDLLVPLKRSPHRTTWSGSWHFPNLISDLTVSRINQVWVADITYILSEKGFFYLALLTDVFSRFIVGFDLSASLVVEGALRALDQAIARTPADHLSGLIHHSDHGVQYTAFAYRDRLLSVNALSSMGEVGNCYDNALAERVNGILKIEYALDTVFVDFDHAFRAVSQAIYLYNFERPHFSLDLAKPAQIYLQNMGNG